MILYPDLKMGKTGHQLGVALGLAGLLTGTLLSSGAHADTPAPVAGQGGAAQAGAQAQPTKDDQPVELGGVVVTGRLNQIAKTIRAKRNADVVSDGVSSDEISSIPEFGLGDALARVPGVVFQINNGRGEDQFMTLRGLNADYSTTTFDGIALPTSEETTRQTSFDILPSVLAKGVDVYKTWTVNLPTDAIGGVVDVHTRSAFDHPGLFVSGHLDGAYWENERELHPNEPSGQADFTLSDTFGPENHFGALLLASFYTRSSDTLNTYTLPWTYYTPATSPGGVLTPNTLTPTSTVSGLIGVPNTHRWYFYDNIRTRPGVFSKLEYNDNEVFHITLSGGLFEHLNNENRYSNYVTKGTGAVVDETSPTTGTVSTGKADIDYDRYFQYRELAYTDLRSEVNFSPKTHLVLDINYGYGHYRQDTIEDQYLTSSSAAYGYSYNLAAPTAPLFTPTNPAAVANLSNYLQQYHLTSVDSSHSTEPQYKLDFTHNTDLGDRGWGFKAGLYHRDLNQSYYYDSYTTSPLPGMNPTLASIGVLKTIYPSNGEGQALIPLDPEAVTAYIAAHPSLYGPTVYSGNINDYHLREIIDAGYGEARYRADRFLVIGGLRWEQTSQTIENLLGASPTTATEEVYASKYAKLLPSLNASYDVTSQLKARAAVTKTLARPEYSQMAENSSANAALGQPSGSVVGTIANPYLKPRESWNYDASLEYYPFAGAQASVAIFDKEIADEIITEQVAAPPPFPQTAGYQVLEAVNAGHARVRGLELSLIDERLSFLPGPLRYLGATANATLLNMDAPDIRMSNNTLQKLPQLLNSAKSVVNASLFYTYGRYFTEVAYNYTDKMPISFDTTNRVNDQWWAAISTIDAQFKVQITRNLYIRLQGKNLTDATPQKVVGPNQVLNYSTLDNGRAYWAGLGFVF
jgi:TonB-dependent receptor